MSGLERNKRLFYDAVPASGTDEWGNTSNKTYANPVAAYANISAAQGRVAQEMFGGVDSYDRVINPIPASMPERTDLRLWVDTLPTLVAGATSTKHDYIVTGIADGLNHSAMAIKKVSIG